MSYAIVRNEKLTRAEANGKATHNDRKAKNHTNKDIDPTETHLNYYLKKNTETYLKEFDKLRKERNLEGHLRENSIIICQMIFTSDQKFFDKIGKQETKRYFDECYKFICNYKNLGEENIISSVVHLDEGAPHLHLMFVPVVHTKDKNGKQIEKICAKDFWKGRDSYRKLQDAYFNHVKIKGFDLERGLYVEDTNRKHMSVEKFKQVTNYAKTKEILKSTTLELPDTPELQDIKKLVLNRDKIIQEQIIKPENKLIKELHNENIALHKELAKQTEIIDIAEDFVKEKENMQNENQNLEQTIGLLKEVTEQNEEDLKFEYENKIDHIEHKYQKKIKELEKKNKSLNKIIDKFKDNLKKFMKWLCRKFSYPCEDDLIRDFEKETYYTLILKNNLIQAVFKKKIMKWIMICRKDLINMNIYYRKCGDDYIPNLAISNTNNFKLGKYGKMRLNFLKTQKKTEYTILLMEDKLSEHLQEIDETATARYNLLMKQFAERKNITEELKANNQLEWIGKMNSIKNRVEEIIFNELIYV